MALKEQGLTDVPKVFTNWMIAFAELKRFISILPAGKKVIFRSIGQNVGYLEVGVRQ